MGDLLEFKDSCLPCGVDSWTWSLLDNVIRLRACSRHTNNMGSDTIDEAPKAKQ